jgi:hypothetical protein
VIVARFSVVAVAELLSVVGSAGVMAAVSATYGLYTAVRRRVADYDVRLTEATLRAEALRDDILASAVLERLPPEQAYAILSDYLRRRNRLAERYLRKLLAMDLRADTADESWSGGWFAFESKSETLANMLAVRRAELAGLASAAGPGALAADQP